MKAMETGAPMISVPAGILKEFMSPANSRTPTPPPVTAVGNSTVTSKSSTQTLTTTSNSVSYTSVLPSSIDTSSVSITPATPISTTPVSLSLTNGQVSKDENMVAVSESEVNQKCAENNKDSNVKENNTGNSDATESMVNGNTSGVKRTSEEAGGSRKPDLKKIRVFPPSGDDGVKRDISIAVQEFNQHLDKASKKLEEAEKQENKDLKTLNELRSCFNNVPTGSGIVSGMSSGSSCGMSSGTSSGISSGPSNGISSGSSSVMSSGPSSGVSSGPSSGISNGDGNSSGVTNPSLLAKALVNTVQSKEVEVVPLASESREVLTPITREREALTNITKDKVIPVVDKENKQIRRRLQKLPRKDLENMILQQFCEKTLYQCELGRMKQLCEKLESTLESNRKKTAQFHKEIEDLRKVTNRLSAEHAARKGQYVAPIRIKRSVGIQAAPHIINKGIMHANGNSGKRNLCFYLTFFFIFNKIMDLSILHAPFVYQMIPTTNGNQNLITTGTVGILATSQPGVGRPQAVGNVAGAASLPAMAASASGLGTVRAAAGQMLMMTPTGSMQALPRASNTGVVSTATAVLPVTQGRVVRAPIGGMNSVVSPAGTLLGTHRPLVLQNDKTVTGTTAGLQSSLATRGSGVIDLTDEDEGSRGGAGRPSSVVPKPGTLVKVPASGTAQLLPIQAGGVGQVVLLPNTSGGQPTTALIVSQVSTAMQTLDNVTNPAVAQSRIGSLGNHTANNSRVMASVVNSTTRTTTSTLPQLNQLRHPAPLPRTPFQQVAGLSKKLPPQPTLKLSHKDSSIVLSWTMSKTEDHETIASYQLYAYQEGAAAPSASLWKKVGSVKALELPMACTLTQFMPGHVYHFAVRAVDTKSRLGPFSDPRSIRLDKKLVSISESL
ncbi:uncharacterized protein [Panulirus ornatus]|uniref:uncharacterized protein n=1 Tax=Panulirus ornatus TaxID=150431 RepID=UPI003A8914F4